MTGIPKRNASLRIPILVHPNNFAVSEVLGRGPCLGWLGFRDQPSPEKCKSDGNCQEKETVEDKITRILKENFFILAEGISGQNMTHMCIIVMQDRMTTIITYKCCPWEVKGLMATSSPQNQQLLNRMAISFLFLILSFRTVSCIMTNCIAKP